MEEALEADAFRIASSSSHTTMGIFLITDRLMPESPDVLAVSPCLMDLIGPS